MAFRESIKDFYDEKHGKEYGTKAVYLATDPEHYHQKILNRIESNQVILDIGCATGYLGAIAKKNGNRVYGIEISESAAKMAKEILDDVVVGNIEEIDLPYPEKYFDIIICSDVIEHLFDPEKVLIKLRKYVKIGGKLMVSVPNIAHYSIRWMVLRGKWEYEDVGAMDYGHLRFFTRETMAQLLEASGYRVREIIPCIRLPVRINLVDNRFFKRRLGRICTSYGVLDRFLASAFLYITEVDSG